MIEPRTSRDIWSSKPFPLLGVNKPKPFGCLIFSFVLVVSRMFSFYESSFSELEGFKLVCDTVGERRSEGHITSEFLGGSQ